MAERVDLMSIVHTKMLMGGSFLTKSDRVQNHMEGQDGVLVSVAI